MSSPSTPVKKEQASGSHNHGDEEQPNSAMVPVEDNGKSVGNDSDSDNAKCSRSTKIMCFVIGFLALAAIVIVSVLLTRGDKEDSNLTSGAASNADVAPSGPTPAPADYVFVPSPDASNVPIVTAAPQPTAPGTTAAPTTAAPTASPTISFAPTPAPTSNRQTEFVNILMSQDINIQESSAAARRALEFMAQEEASMVVDEEAVVQRFGLLSTLFGVQSLGSTVVAEDAATSVPSMIPIPAVPNSESGANLTSGMDVLEDGSFLGMDGNDGNGNNDGMMGMGGGFMGQFGGARRQLQEFWTLEDCEWPGVTCNTNGTVTEIRWGSMNYQGTIPSEIGLLKSLTYIDLSQNDIQGSIPESLYELTNLERLYLYQNQLTGTISPSIGNLWELTHIRMSHNQLTGTIPDTKVSGMDIRPYFEINLKSNRLTGTIPSGLRWRQLFFLDLGFNQLTGTLPEDLGTTFVRLRHLHLDHNRFVGTLPSSYINVGNGRLQQLTINDNQLTGTVPSNHQLLNNLWMFTLQNNQFTGRLGSTTCRLSVFIGGENAEFKADCDICTCGNFFCDYC